MAELDRVELDEVGQVKFLIEGSNGEQCPEGALNPPADNNIYHMCSFDHVQGKLPRLCAQWRVQLRFTNINSFLRYLRLRSSD